MPRSARCVPVALLCVVVALTFASCGGSSLSLNASTNATPTKSALVPAGPPTTLPPEGFEIGRPVYVLLMPSTADPTMLKVSSAAAAITAAPQNDIPKTARALFASVTQLSGPIKNRLAWVVTYDWEKSREIPWTGTLAGASEPPPHYAHGQVSIIDARSGRFLLGYCLMNP